MIRLLPITSAIASSTADPDAFRQATGADPGPQALVLGEAVAQNEIHRAKTGAPPEWGGHLAIDDTLGVVVGVCAFVSAPDADGLVEIAYFTLPGLEGQGIGKAMAAGLIQRAEKSGRVRTVIAHTLPDTNASTSILARLGFERAGTAHDPDEGTVWRWARPVGGVNGSEISSE